MTALRAAGALSGFCLAGGTGLALRFAHRASEYLDFFRPDDLETEDLLARLRAAAVPLVADHQDAGTLRLAIGPEGVAARRA